METESDVANQTTFTLPPEGSCEGKAMLELANDVKEGTLNDGGLSSAASRNIVAARPLDTLADLDAVAQVGPAALATVFDLAKARGLMAGCGAAPVGNPSEIGIISDLDDTVIPESVPDLAKAPFPGVRALYNLLENHNGGKPGDVYYVTARKPERVVEVPAYLAQHGIPAGPIDTGTSGAPFIARPEKVKDMKKILERTSGQKFVLFGDTTHVDPDVQRDMLAAAPDRMIAGIIHKTTASVDPERVKGLHVVENYAEAAAVLVKLNVITKSEAKAVIADARKEGLDITAAREAELLD
jgi:hypothetical protein